MAPVIHRFQKQTDRFRVVVCVTGQHREMLRQTNEFFQIVPDYDLELMKPNQSLAELTSRAVSALDPIIEREQPDLLFVQGDTTSAFVGALDAYYHRIPVAHVEAGLRTRNKYSPFPEEINRRLIGEIATLHFAPTKRALQALESEGAEGNIYQVGNTVIDALLLARSMLPPTPVSRDLGAVQNALSNGTRLLLVTTHRRESFGTPLEDVCLALLDIIRGHPETHIILPVHRNPNVRTTVEGLLAGQERITLTEPLDYPDLVWLMDKAFLILTDSGGIQEEAPSLGKPVLVLRNETERIEGIDAGTALLVGTKREKIVSEAQRLLNDDAHYRAMAEATNPYGDGTAATKISTAVSEYFHKEEEAASNE